MRSSTSRRLRWSNTTRVSTPAARREVDRLQQSTFPDWAKERFKDVLDSRVVIRHLVDMYAFAKKVVIAR
ncbi:hypothetical protein PybrP1_006053 [[Pythium] brassicae (nom. inval.)]|nr:hypothetical protein PybrP1_006053 [[Pythium] brassicae (nom. inval.)]